MALTGFCTVCQRTAYVDADATPICPVCSSPLLDASAVAPEEDTDDQESVASAEK